MDNLFTRCLFSVLLLFLTLQGKCQASPTFKVIPLGVKGGSDESNLSSYMLAPEGSNSYVCLDAGTIQYGIEKAVETHIFKTTSSNVLRNYIKGYLISHAHLDHIAGLILNSPDDTVKNIYGLPYCLDILKEKYFNWKSWANFANEGDKPQLNQYHYIYVASDKETGIENTQLHVRAFPLSHSYPYQSTAFLVRFRSSYLLYLGDTGADEIEKAENLHVLWEEIAPLISAKKLKGIFIEVSFPDQQPLKQIFGHLTPTLLMGEMDKLCKLTCREAMKNFKLIITHIKPAGNHEAEIKKQLRQLNKLNIHLIFPQQAQVLKL